MKKFLFVFSLAIFSLYFGCSSASEAALKTGAAIPKWITDEGRLEIFPDSAYISQLGYGNTAQESKYKSAASISEYIKSSVKVSVSASSFCRVSGNAAEEAEELRTDIQIYSDNNLYKVEYTNPWYYADIGQYVCAAFINREQAFDFVKPKLEIAKNQFPKAYKNALEKTSLLEKNAE